MTRLLGPVVALLLLVGTLGFAGPASAAPCADADYVPCEGTRTTVVGREELTRPALPVVGVRVRLNGNVKPVGRVTLTFRRKGGGFVWSRTFGYPGGVKHYRGPKLSKAGRYVVVARYVPKPHTIFSRSSDAYILRVVR